MDISASIAFHKKHGRLATVTAINPPGRFGVLDIAERKVNVIREKPDRGDAWINGGFFVLEPDALETVPNDQMPWDREPMETLASRGELMAFEHEGFWQPMDTLREKMLLEDLWESGKAPWKKWQD